MDSYRFKRVERSDRWIRTKKLPEPSTGPGKRFCTTLHRPYRPSDRVSTNPPCGRSCSVYLPVRNHPNRRTQSDSSHRRAISQKNDGYIGKPKPAWDGVFPITQTCSADTKKVSRCSQKASPARARPTLRPSNLPPPASDLHPPQERPNYRSCPQHRVGKRGKIHPESQNPDNLFHGITNTDPKCVVCFSCTLAQLLSRFPDATHLELFLCMLEENAR